MNNKFTIQQVAEITRLSVHTLRYYERIGLLEPVQRNSSGYREYTENEVAWLGILNCLRNTGMTIRQMKHYAFLCSKGSSTINERRGLLEEHQHEVQNQIFKLEQNLKLITKKIAHYKNLEVVNN